MLILVLLGLLKGRLFNELAIFVDRALGLILIFQLVQKDWVLRLLGNSGFALPLKMSFNKLRRPIEVTSAKIVLLLFLDSGEIRLIISDF